MTNNSDTGKRMTALLEENRKYKAAFMSLLGDYVCNAVYGNCYNDTFCEVCPLQKHQWGGCSKDLNKDFAHDTCAEEIFKFYVKFYVENSNDNKQILF